MVIDMKKPLIGILPLVDTERESYWMLPGYMNGIERTGGFPIMLPLTSDEKDIRQMAELCDGFLFTGGHDVSPMYYREERLPECGECCIERDCMEGALLKEVVRRDKAVLGICRGIQLINAMFGGTLYQDLPTQYPSDLEHHQTPPYDVPVHEVILTKDTPLYDVLKIEKLQVNSYHHQGIKRLAPELCSMAVAQDGLVEAVYLPGKRFVWAVQWHPEFSFQSDEASCRIFETFVRASKL